MNNHEQETVSIMVNLTEVELQAAIELGLKTALKPHEEEVSPPLFTSTHGKASGVFGNQWRRKAQW